MIGHRYLETMFAVKKAIQTSFLKLAPNNKDLLCICGSWHRISNWKLCYTRTQKNVFFSPYFLQDVRHAKKNFFECVMMLNFVMCIFCHKKREFTSTSWRPNSLETKPHSNGKRNHISFPFVTRMHKKPKFHYLYRKAVKVVNHLEQWRSLVGQHQKFNSVLKATWSSPQINDQWFEWDPLSSETPCCGFSYDKHDPYFDHPKAEAHLPVNFSPIWMMIKISKPWTLFAKRDWPFTCQNWFRIISFFSCAEACGIPTASGRSLPLLLPTAAAAQWWLLPKGSGTPKGREPLSLLWKPDFKCKFSIDLVVNARYCLRTF